MKNKILSMLFGLFILSGTVFSQIESEINTYVDSTEILVNNGKKLLLKKVQEKDYVKVTEIYNFLSAKTVDQKCFVFDYTEELYLFCFMSDSESWLNKAADLSKYKASTCYPTSLKIHNQLYEALRSNVDFFQQKMNSLALNTEDQALFDLYFYIIKNGGRDELYDQKVNKFNKLFPASRYKYFVNNYLPKPLSKFSMAYSFGAVGFYPNQKLADYFNSGVGFNMSWDLRFNKIYTSLYLNAGDLRLTKDLVPSNYSHTFQPNDRFSYVDGGLIGGYYLIRSKKIHVAPYIALGGSSIQSNLYKESNENNKELFIYNSFFVGPGFHTEMKLFDYKSAYGYGYNSPEMDFYFSLKLEGGYNYITRKNTFLGGDISYVRAAIVWGIGSF